MEKNEKKTKRGRVYPIFKENIGLKFLTILGY